MDANAGMVDKSELTLRQAQGERRRVEWGRDRAGQALTSHSDAAHYSRFMPVRFLRGSLTRLALTVIALACGVALVCAIDLVNRAVLAAFVDVIDTMAGRAALQVSAGSGALFPEEIAATVGAVAGVELAVPVVSATAFTADTSGELLTVQGIDLTSEEQVRVYEARDDGGAQIDDPLVFLNQPDSIVLTRAFAQRRGLAIDDKIALETPTGGKAFTIRGLLEPHGVARVYGGNLMVMDLMAAEAAFTRPGQINRVDVVVARDRELAQVSAAIAAALPEGLHVEAPVQRKVDLHKVMQSLQVLLQGIGLIGLIAAFLLAFNRLSTVFDGRAWQIGVLRAIGTRARRVWWELVKESLLLGIAGTVLGVPLGVGFAHLLLPLISTTTAIAAQQTPTQATLTVRIESIALAAAMGIGAALLAALLPAWRAAHVGIIGTIRGRGTEQSVVAPHAWVLRALVAAGIGAVLGLQSMTHAAAWGLLATALIAIGAAMSARPLLRTLFSSILRQRLGYTTGMATAMVTQNPRRGALTVAMIGVGLGLVLWLWVVAGSFERSVTESLVKTLHADLVVSSTHTTAGYLETPVDERLVTEVARLPQVAVAAGGRSAEWRYDDGPVILNALDSAFYLDPGVGQPPFTGWHTADAWEAVARGDAVVVSTNFVLNLGKHVGDTITLDTPRGPLRLLIKGAVVEYASPRGVIYMSRVLYQRYWNDPQVNRVLVRLVPGADVEAARATIARDLGHAYSLRILSSRETAEYFADQVRQAFVGAHVLAGMVLLVVLVGMGDTLAADVNERTRELGAIRALGVRRRFVQRMVVAEALLLGALGLLLAGAVGTTLGILWVDATFPYLLGWLFALHFPYAQAAIIAGVTLGICFISALLPARRAARLEPAVALRDE